MGYGYGRNGALACDRCGNTGGVRKRTCPHRVAYPQDGPNYSLAYCKAPALCTSCYRAEGGIRLHDRCAEPARKATEENKAIAARIASGDPQVMSAWGDWHAAVPAGSTGVMFAPNRTDRWQEKTYRLVPEADYDPGTKKFLSDYPRASPWAGPDLAKESA